MNSEHERRLRKVFNLAFLGRVSDGSCAVTLCPKIKCPTDPVGTPGTITPLSPVSSFSEFCNFIDRQP